MIVATLVSGPIQSIRPMVHVLVMEVFITLREREPQMLHSAERYVIREILQTLVTQVISGSDTVNDCLVEIMYNV